mmetsp:Transcript_20550/g.38619  ORF Transcript_20550/g.38619 Transcript_20550/m.38619 type:complete len:93 (+) Transcript_20550:76-354(+)
MLRYSLVILVLLLSAEATSAFSWFSKAATSDQGGRERPNSDGEDANMNFDGAHSERIDSIGEDSVAETVAHRIGDLADNDDFLGAFHGYDRK